MNRPPCTIFNTGLYCGNRFAVCNFLDNALREVGHPPSQFIVKKYDDISFTVQFYNLDDAIPNEVGMKAIRLLYSRATVTQRGWFFDE